MEVQNALPRLGSAMCYRPAEGRQREKGWSCLFDGRYLEVRVKRCREFKGRTTRVIHLNFLVQAVPAHMHLQGVGVILSSLDSKANGDVSTDQGLLQTST